MKKKPSNRIWLNPDKTKTGTLAWRVESWGSGYVEIRDCNRAITLEFDYEATKKASLKKLDRIIEELYTFRKHLAEAK